MNETPRVAIVMSRIPRLIAPDAAWLAGLRACLRVVRGRSGVLLVSPQTAGADFVIRGAQRLEIETVDVAAWDPAENAGPDRQLIDHADQVFVLGVRSNGNVHRSLVKRLQSGRAGITLVDLPDLQPPAVRSELAGLGAADWSPSHDECRPLTEQPDTLQAGSDQGRILTFESYPHTLAHEFLIHTTRACPGAWPQQSAEDYLDALLDSRADACHSALQTLLRIVRQRLLIAAGRTIRGGFPVVSFTDVALNQLPDLRIFRTHRTRWDFEPYGICIRRSALESCEARKVNYGSEKSWLKMADADRPYFQLAGGAGDEGHVSTIDWSAEREWRVRGDLDLAQFGPQDLFVFVPRYEDAKLLQPHCRWPITLWPGDPKS